MDSVQVQRSAHGGLDELERLAPTRLSSLKGQTIGRPLDTRGRIREPTPQREIAKLDSSQA